MTDVDVHATGVLSDLLAIGRALNPWWLRRSPWPSWLPRHKATEEARRFITEQGGGWRWNAVRHRGRRLLVNARRRNAWHGFHAEPLQLPPGVRRIGTGWTRRRALADLHRAYREAEERGPRLVQGGQTIVRRP